MSRRTLMWAVFSLANGALGVVLSSGSPLAVSVSLLLYAAGVALLRKRLPNSVPTQIPLRLGLVTFWLVFSFAAGAQAAAGIWDEFVGSVSIATVALWFLVNLKDRPDERARFVRPASRKAWLLLLMGWLAIAVLYLAALLLLLYDLSVVLAFHESGLRALIGVALIGAFHIPVGYLVRGPLAVVLPWVPVIAGVIASPDPWEEAYWFAALVGITPFGLLGVAIGRSRYARRRQRKGPRLPPRWPTRRGVSDPLVP